QMALSTGITYYHRGNNLLGFNSQVEPPNFFNPFWRAGLTRLNVDDPGLGNGDVESALSGYPAAVDSFQGLKANGFKGWQ
ncbi:MAG: pilus assembly protein, partial [Myxococcaceae bacterium]